MLYLTMLVMKLLANIATAPDASWTQPAPADLTPTVTQNIHDKSLSCLQMGCSTPINTRGYLLWPWHICWSWSCVHSLELRLCFQTPFTWWQYTASATSSGIAWALFSTHVCHLQKTHGTTLAHEQVPCCSPTSTHLVHHTIAWPQVDYTRPDEKVPILDTALNHCVPHTEDTWHAFVSPHSIIAASRSYKTNCGNMCKHKNIW